MHILSKEKGGKVMHQSGSGFMGGLITLGLAFLAFYFLLRPKKGEQSPVWNIPFFLVFTLNIYHIFWLYRVFKKLYMYNATETSPGEAVGFLFIPFFNLVWIFIIWSRLGKAISKAYLLSGLSEPSTEIVLLFPLSS